MDMLRVASFAVAAALAAAVIRRMRPEAGMALALAAGVMLLIAALTQVETVVQALEDLCRKAELQPVHVRTLFKVVGICLLTEIAASICRDTQEEGLAVKVELAGRVMVLALAAPVLSTLLGQLLELT